MSYDHAEFEFDKELDINVNAEFNLEVNSDVNVYKDVDVDVDINSEVCIEGNAALFNIDVEALGDDSYAELNLVVLTTEGSSSIIATGESAVG